MEEIGKCERRRKEGEEEVKEMRKTYLGKVL